MLDRDLIARACETNAGWLALGNERFAALDAIFLRNRATPRRHDVNTAVLVRTAGAPQVEALLRRIDEEYAGFGHRRIELDPLTPATVAAQLSVKEGYKAHELLVLVLEGELRAAPRAVEIREAVSEVDWAAYRRLDEAWWRESSTEYFGPYDPGLHDELSLSFRLKTPPARSWLAYVDSVTRAYVSSWEGENGVGMVEDLFTEAEFRHRGLATALLAHAVADARARGAGPVVITADPKDTPRQMYMALGFRPLYLARSYTKLLPPAAP